jgi:hypothetical protein
MFLSDDLGNFASKSVLDDHLRSARDNLVSENHFSPKKQGKFTVFESHYTELSR